MREEDVGRLSPLGHEHINMLGRYAFSLPDRIARGELRPLRNPRQLDEAAWGPYLVKWFRCYSDPIEQYFLPTIAPLGFFGFSQTFARIVFSKASSNFVVEPIRIGHG